MKTILLILAAIAFVFPASSQTADSAKVFSANEVAAQLAQSEASAKSKGGGGVTLGDYGSHALKLSSRSSDGEAEVHGHFDDVMVVKHGTATLITGGTLIDPRAGSDGEMKGSGIRNGVTQQIAEGDIIHIPAGTPHQLLIPKGTVFSTFVVKVREKP